MLRPSPRPRRGAALPTALLMLVVLSALAGGSFAMSRQSFRGGRNALVEQRAFGVAEAGLNRRIGNWNPALNAPEAAGGVPVGQTLQDSIYVANGDTAYVRITRLDDMLFSVQSLGRASIPNPDLQSARNVGALVRVAYPSINPKGAITAGGGVTLGGSSKVIGSDTLPAGWTAGNCADMRGPALPGVAVPPNAGVSGADHIVTTAPNAWIRDPAAGDSNTYVRYGTESWTTLANAATIRYAPGEDPGNTIQPVAAGGVCRRDIKSNWGEPWRTAGNVAPCAGYFPIIYVDGNLDLQSNGRGQGILMINGDLRLRGSFEWVGLIIVRNDVKKGNGNATVTGAVMAANLDLGESVSVDETGNQTVAYSKCALESVLRGSAMLIRVSERAWTQIF